MSADPSVFLLRIRVKTQRVCEWISCMFTRHSSDLRVTDGK